MSIVKFLNESLLGKTYDKPIYIIPRGLKSWLPTINKVIKKVPNEAIPSVVCAFSASNSLLGRKIITPQISKSKNAFFYTIRWFRSS